MDKQKVKKSKTDVGEEGNSSSSDSSSVSNTDTVILSGEESHAEEDMQKGGDHQPNDDDSEESRKKMPVMVMIVIKLKRYMQVYTMWDFMFQYVIMPYPCTFAHPMLLLKVAYTSEKEICTEINAFPRAYVKNLLTSQFSNRNERVILHAKQKLIISPVDNYE